MTSGLFKWEEQIPYRGGEGSQEREGTQHLDSTLQGSPSPLPPCTHLSSASSELLPGEGPICRAASWDMGKCLRQGCRQRRRSQLPRSGLPRGYRQSPHHTCCTGSLLPAASEGCQCAGLSLVTVTSMSHLSRVPGPPTFPRQNLRIIK